VASPGQAQTEALNFSVTEIPGAIVRAIFRTIIVLDDLEYEVAAGGLPNVLCMLAYVLDEHLQHVRTIRLWRGEFGSRPPFNIGPETLVVGYSAWAEMLCFLVLGWPFPEHIFDLHTATSFIRSTMTRPSAGRRARA
jgi:hypothetical protein